MSDGFRLIRRLDPRARLGRQPAREVVRGGEAAGPRAPRHERALAAEPGRDIAGLRLQVVPERRLNEPRHERASRCRGVLRAVPLCRRAPARRGERPLVVALDQVTDPHNLGASSARRGRRRERRRNHRAKRGARDGGRVQGAAGAVEHLPVAAASTSPATWRDQGPAALVWAADGGATPRVASGPGPGVALAFGSAGRGLSPACGGPATTRSCPARGTVESLNVSVAAGVSLFEAARQRRGS